MPSLPSEDALTGAAFAEVRESLTMLAGEMLGVPQRFCRHGLCRRVGACRWRDVAARPPRAGRRPEPLPAQPLPAQLLPNGRPGCQVHLDDGQRALVDALARAGLELCERMLDDTLDGFDWSGEPATRERQLAAVEIVRAMVPAGPMRRSFSRWRRRIPPPGATLGDACASGKHSPADLTEHPEVGPFQD